VFFTAHEIIPSGEVVQYLALDRGIPNYVQQLKKYCQAPDCLRLKLGAQVMLLKNLAVEEGLVNGSRGVVVGFATDSEQNLMDGEAPAPLTSAAAGKRMPIGM
jgi:DNA helicase Pif1, 2B domain